MKVLEQQFKATANILVSAAPRTESYVTTCVCVQTESTFSSQLLFFFFFFAVLKRAFTLHKSLAYLCHLKRRAGMNSDSAVCQLFVPRIRFARVPASISPIPIVSHLVRQPLQI